MKILTIPKMIEYIHKRGVLPNHKRGKKKDTFLNAVCAFDIETYTLEDPALEDKNAAMYIWQFACEDMCCYGRTWEQYKVFIESLSDLRATLAVFVHNLSYEFQFLAGIFDFQTEDVFCTAPRRILKARSGPVEYRCSMLLSNDSLAGFCDKHKVEHRKQSGERYDYSRERFYFTPLTLYEYKYALYDVIGLVEAVKAEMKAESRDLYTLPMTSTGYVRQDVKTVLYKFNRYKQRFLQPTTPLLYWRLKEAMRGGNTHANRYFANVTIDHPGICIDISSDYPFQMCSKKFPMSGWRITDASLDNYVNLKQRGYMCLLVIECFGLYLKDKYDGFPPVSKSKCRNLYGEVVDNGRILSAVYFETTLTDIDFEILLDHYEGDIRIKELYYCRSDYLPAELREYILKHYVDKTALKGVTGEYAEIRYMQAKNRLNSIYGLSVQDVLKVLIEWIEGQYVEKTSEDLQTRLNKNLTKAYMSFSWGVWVTAYARQQLEKGLSYFNKEGFAIYCDTDSVFGIGDVDLEDLNKEFLYYSKKHGLQAQDKNGKTHYMGVFELDKSFDQIRVMGAKKYAYIKNDKLQVTIAGVNKKKGREQLAAAGGLDAMVDGFVFKGVNSNAIYNDSVDTVITKYGRPVRITRNVALEESDYTLGLTGDYEYILTHPECFYNL